jgi:DNA-binding MarR family transcriptional regulator
MAAFLSRATLESTVSKRTAKAKTPRRSSKSSCPWLTISANGSNLNFEDFLTFRLTRLTNAQRTNLTKRYLEEFELSLPEWRLLAMIARFAPMRFSEVTSRSSMDKGQVSRTLRVMEKRGLTKMKTMKGAASDALAAPVTVSITPKGAALYKAVLPAARRRQAEMILSLSESERLRLYETIDKLSATIGHAVVSQDESE